MSSLEAYADESQSATERLLERSWEGRERRASERELMVEAAAANCSPRPPAPWCCSPGGWPRCVRRWRCC